MCATTRSIGRPVVGKTSEEIGDRAAELATKTRLLLVVPVLGLFEVVFRQASNNDVVLHRLERRSATSLHGDSAPGFFCRSSNRRLSSRRCESDTGSAAVFAPSATMSQIAATSSILSFTLSRFASSFCASGFVGLEHPLGNVSGSAARAATVDRSALGRQKHNGPRPLQARISRRILRQLSRTPRPP